MNILDSSSNFCKDEKKCNFNFRLLFKLILLIEFVNLIQMKKSIKIIISTSVIAVIISLNMIVTFQKDNQTIKISSITSAFADGESWEPTNCYIGYPSPYGEYMYYCGNCTIIQMVPFGNGYCSF